MRETVASETPITVASSLFVSSSCEAALSVALVSTAASEPADLIYGGTTGALAAVAEAASRLGIPYGLDLEDFHSAEQDTAEGALANALAARVETATLTNAAFLTAASPMIADAYRSKYGVEPTPIHNTFSLRFSEHEMTDRPGPLRLYWFSQTLGPGRGIEDAIEAEEGSVTPQVGELRLDGQPALIIEAVERPDEVATPAPECPPDGARSRDPRFGGAHRPRRFDQ